MMVESKLQRPRFACRECPSGVMNIRFVTYFTQLDDEMVMVPDFPAWVCDVCGFSAFDEKAVNMISIMLNPSTGHIEHKRNGGSKKGRQTRGLPLE